VYSAKTGNEVRYGKAPATSHYTWDDNTYYNIVAGRDQFTNDNDAMPYNQNGGMPTFWRSSSVFNPPYDVNSTASSAGMPLKVLYVPSAYQLGLCTIIVYAPAGTTSVNVDMTKTGFPLNHNYGIKKAFNYYGDYVKMGSYLQTASAIPETPIIPVSMSNAAATAVATPVGCSYTPATTSPRFACWILVDLGVVA
jgi:hypothetical protein